MFEIPAVTHHCPEHSHVTNSINLMNSTERALQCKLHILSRFAEFFPLNLHLCRSLAFSQSDQSILHAPPSCHRATGGACLQGW